MAFGAYEYVKVKGFPAHKSMLDVAEVIFQTCKTYLIQQGKLLIILEIFIGVCIAYYFGFLQQMDAGGVILILIWSVGISLYGVACPASA
jgi:K(+)-stimulated pyrophosphate-energized sodium pump